MVRTGYRALRGVMAFERSSLEDCDRILSAAVELSGSPILSAWRAHLRVVTMIERLAIDECQTAEEAIALAASARERDPLNPIVSAIAADVALHVEGLAQKATHLARIAVERSPSSPFTRASYAQALARLGRDREAHVEATRALRLAIGQPNQGWWYMRCCVTAVRLGHFQDAAHYALVAPELTPNFRPPSFGFALPSAGRGGRPRRAVGAEADRAGLLARPHGE